MKILFALLFALALAFGGAGAACAAEKPNIVFLLADDLGYGDLTCTGHPYARTPSIDQLAREGTLFQRFYVGGATCCPSRTAFMTGRYPATFQKYPASLGFGGAVTVTELLKKNGYRTALFGKWHIGDRQRPGTYGIDVVKVSGGNRRDPRGRDARVADDAIDFLRANKSGPVYMNVWFHTPHNPVNPPQSFVDRFKNVTVDRADFKNPDMVRHLDDNAKAGEDVQLGVKKRLGDVLQLDGQVARVLKAIDDLGLRKNTIVVFTSDNGPNAYGSAGPCRERKHSLHDGGIRLPFIIRWPGRVKAGRVDERSVTAGVDWLPTLAAITGVKIDADKFPGEDVSDVWLGRERPRHKDLFRKASNAKSPAVVLRHDWKLYLPARRGAAELYDLSKDAGERVNLAAGNPALVKTLTATLTRWKATLPKQYEKAAGDDKGDR